MKTYNVLFLCTHNSARSVLGEAVASTLSNGRLIGYSAGSHPSSVVNPYAIKVASELGYDTNKLRSKSWDEYATADAIKMDFVITVCDNAANEICPFFPASPTTAHWGFADPSSVVGTEEEKLNAFRKVADGLKLKLNKLLALDLDNLNVNEIKNEIKKL
jgi:arsenate reductase (thioredoxin)